MSSKSSLPQIIWAVLMLSTVLVQFSAAQVKTNRIESEQDVNHWAVDRESGRVFAALGAESLVVEFDHADRQVREFALENTPQYLLIKNGLLVVSQGTDTVNRNNEKSRSGATCSLSVIDLETNLLKGTVDLPGKSVGNLFCSQQDNPYVGVIVHGTDDSVLQIDLDSLSIRKAQEMQRWGQSSAVNIAMSADGRYVVPDARGYRGPSGADLMRVDEDAFSFIQIRDYHDSFGPVTPGPASRSWLLGNKIYSLDLQSHVRSVGGNQGSSVHPDLDLVASSMGNKLLLETFSNVKRLAEIEVDSEPNSGHKRASRLLRNNPTIQVFFDDQLHAYHCFGRTCHVVDVEALGLNLEPLYMLVAPDSATARLETTLEIPVAISNPDLAAKTDLQIESGPANATLENNVLQWTPGPEHLGTQQFVIKASADKLSDSMSISVSVSSPVVPVNFSISGFNVDPFGTRAIAWGKRIPQNPNERMDSNADDEFCVIDLETSKILVQKTMPPISAAMIDDKYVYVSQSSGNLLHRWDRDTMENDKRLFLRESVAGLWAVPGAKFALASQSSSAGLKIHDRESMISAKIRRQLRQQKPPVAVVPGNRVVYADRMSDWNTGNVVAVFADPGFARLANLNPAMEQQGRNRIPHHVSGLPNYWGRLISHQGIHSSNGALIRQHETSFGGSKHLMGRAAGLTQPVLYTVLSAAGNENSGPRQRTIILKTNRLSDGVEVDERVIAVTELSGRQVYYSNPDRVAVTDQQLVVASPTEIVIAPLPSIPSEQLEQPLHFRIPEIPPLSVEKIQQVALNAVGGKGGLKYALKTRHPLIELNEMSGEIVFDAPRLWKKFITTFPNSNSSVARDRRNRSRQTPQQSPGEIFQDLYGKKLPTGHVPSTVPVDLVVTDDEGQYAELSIFVTFLGPQSDIDASRVAREQKQRRQRALADASRMVERGAESLLKMGQKILLASPNHASTPDSPQSSVAGIENPVAQATENHRRKEQVSELESRMDQIESKLDAVLEKLDQIQSDK